MLDLSELHGKQCYIGYSGGLDSTALAVHVARYLTANPGDFSCTLIHVNHGLSQSAGAWEAHCLSMAEKLNIPCIVVQINITGTHNLEARARFLRYQAFEQHLSDGDVLLTGHHLNDQSETFLLQAVRGSGVKGLSAMSHINVRHLAAGGAYQHMRPCLHLSKADLTQQLGDFPFVEDESNKNLCYARNHMRHKVLPLLEEKWPGVHKVLARNARHQAEADVLLSEYAARDFSNSVCGKKNAACILDNVLLKTYSRARLCNLMRYACDLFSFQQATEAKLIDLYRSVIHSSYDAVPQVSWGGCEVRRFKERVYLMEVQLPFDASMCYPWDLKSPLVINNNLVNSVQLSDFFLTHAVDPSAAYRVSFRQGGERITLPNKNHSTLLKHYFQEKGVPPWDRARVPLLYGNDRLVGVWKST